MATTIDFPASPAVNDTYTYSGATYVWNGVTWNLQSPGEAAHTGEVTGLTTLTIASGVVDVDNLAAELKATTALGSVSGTVNINWALGIQFNLTLTGATTLTFSNMVQGKTITLIVTGNFTLAFPTSVKGPTTGFSGIKTNQIQLYCFDGTTPQCSVGILNW